MGSRQNLLGTRELARHAVELARRAGAQEAAAAATRSRGVSVEWRDGRVERVTEATERALQIDLYVDGRYGAVTTSDLRPEALAAFVGNAVTLTRALVVDKDRRLPDPELYLGRSATPLELEDPAQAAVSPEERKRFAAAIEAAARAVPGAQAIISVSTGFEDGWNEIEVATSNGFEGSKRSTSFSVSGSVSVNDGARRPEEVAYRVARFRSDLPAADAVGRQASERALARGGATKGKSAVLPVLVENRAAGRLVSMLNGPLGGATLQQKRSFLEGKLGQPLGSKLLSFIDQPFVARGLGSRHFDAEGIAARPRPIFEEGVLASYYLDTYYARKLATAPTSGSVSNLQWKLGDRSLEELIAAAGDAMLVTSFLGGNSNAATGDFSLGVQGFRVTRGKIAEPMGEMNLSGNQTDLWKRLSAVGNDPFLSSAMRTPTLAFDGLQIAGV